MTVARRRAELDALSCTLCSLIQPVAKPMDHIQDANPPIRRENHAQQNFALHPKLTRFGGIYGSWFALNQNWNRGRCLTNGFQTVLLRHWSAGCIDKSSGLNMGLAASTAALYGDAISKACTGDCSTRAFGAAASIAITATGRKIERSGGGDIRTVAAVGIDRHSVWIAEATGLHLAGSNLLQSWSGRASIEGIGSNNFVYGLGAGKGVQHFGVKARRCHGKLRLGNVLGRGAMHALRLPNFERRRLNFGRGHYGVKLDRLVRWSHVRNLCRSVHQ